MEKSRLDGKIYWNLPVRFMDIWYRLPAGNTVWCVAERKVMRMDELLDKLAQDIEARVDQLRKEWQARTPEQNPEEIVGRLNRIMKGLPEDDRYFLDGLLLDKDTLFDEERMWFYRSGLADALDILRYLRR